MAGHGDERTAPREVELAQLAWQIECNSIGKVHVTNDRVGRRAIEERLAKEVHRVRQGRGLFDDRPCVFEQGRHRIDGVGFVLDDQHEFSVELLGHARSQG
jgi:hypothetical protein